MISRILLLRLVPVAMLPAEVTCSLRAAVVCFTALDKEEKKPPPELGAGRGAGSGDVAGRGPEEGDESSPGPGGGGGGGSGLCKSVMYPLGKLAIKLLSDNLRRR